MHKVEGRSVYAATDLVGFLACAHLTNLERAALAGKVQRPDRDDPELDTIRKRGFEHEQRYLDHLRSQGKQVTEIRPDASGDAPEGTRENSGERLRRQVRETLEAIRRGDEVIYQAAFFDGTWRGHADFLLRVDGPSILGPWSYEIADTKLAHEVKASAVLQICSYVDQLERIQGVQPEFLHVALGGSAGKIEKLRVADYMAYYRLVKARFERFVREEIDVHSNGTLVVESNGPDRDGSPAADGAGPGVEGNRSPTTAIVDLLDSTRAANPAAYPPIGTYPEPVEHCHVCRWITDCLGRWRSDDYLSLVAGITSRQREGLKEHGVKTRRALGTLPLPAPRIEGTSPEGITRVRDQARLQVEGEDEGRVKHELLDPRDRKTQEVEVERGLTLLPPPSPGDLFFDMEGDPFAFHDGLEYLFGVIEPGPELAGDRQTLGLVEPRFHAWWSRNEAREGAPFDRLGEKRAFERFIDFVMERWERDPNLHVYHYGAYERGRMARLSTAHATREDAVDRLLRAGVFVDLYRVVRQGVRVSQESYSIKKLEPLYRLERKVELRHANESIVEFERYLEEGGGDPAVLEQIRLYNRDDCLSTWKLRDWLEERRWEAERLFGVQLPRPEPKSDAPSEALSQQQQQVQAAVVRLTDGVPDEDAERTREQRARWLLAQLLDWHRREDKSAWWRYFGLRDMTDEELRDEGEPIAGLEYVGIVGGTRQSWIHRYRFPPQENDIDAGTDVTDPATKKTPGSVHAIDQDAGTVDLKRAKNSETPHPTALVPLLTWPNVEQRKALLRVGEWVAENGIDGPGPYRAARDLLLQLPPRAGQGDAEHLVRPDESQLDAAKRLALALDSTVLPIQGPPGSGKTYMGARMIVELVRAGRKVGIVANSHKVIGKLLADVCRYADETSVAVRAIQKATEEQRCEARIVKCTNDNGEVHAKLAAGEVDIAAGTAWLWSRADMANAVDTLFVDEAGQMALANVVAVSGAARNLVLLGDPQQLDQPLQGSHPTGAEKSALGHLLSDRRTMDPTRGLFLERTWRLHPSITAFTSDVFYEGRLESEPHLAQHHIGGDDAFADAGLRYVPVRHEGRQNDAPEEAATVAHVIESLLGRDWTDEQGRVRPLTLDQILVITPYNAQVSLIKRTLEAQGLPTARVGTVDKFQGQEGAVSIYSMASSTPEDAPRGLEFLYSLNRLNVATSRAKALAILVCSPKLLEVRCHSPRQMQLANALCRFLEMAVIGLDVVADQKRLATAVRAEVSGAY